MLLVDIIEDGAIFSKFCEEIQYTVVKQTVDEQSIFQPREESQDWLKAPMITLCIGKWKNPRKIPSM